MKACASEDSTVIRLSGTQKFVLYVVLGALSALMLLPFAWMLLSSVKTNSQLFATPISWWVWPLRLDNYARALDLIPFWSQLRNTVLLSVLTVIGTVLSSSFTAYGLAKVQWGGRRVLLGVLIITMLLPSIVTLVPTYVIFRDLGWVNTYLPLIVPTFLGTPYYIFLFRQFFLRIPESMSEAASVVFTLPLVIIFFVGNKYILSGISFTTDVG
jgi:multiple sugar transport system permease protein